MFLNVYSNTAASTAKREIARGGPAHLQGKYKYVFTSLSMYLSHLFWKTCDDPTLKSLSYPIDIFNYPLSWKILFHAVELKGRISFNLIAVLLHISSSSQLSAPANFTRCSIPTLAVFPNCWLKFRLDAASPLQFGEHWTDVLVKKAERRAGGAPASPEHSCTVTQWALSQSHWVF